MANLGDKGKVVIDLGSETLDCWPLMVSIPTKATAGDTVDFSFDIPEGVEPINVVCVLAQVK